MMTPREVTERHWSAVQAILARYVGDRSVWVYGSRSTGRNLRRGSDLDLAVEGRFAAGVRGDLEGAFEESIVPFKVDVVAVGELDDAFLRRVQKDFELVQEGLDLPVSR